MSATSSRLAKSSRRRDWYRVKSAIIQSTAAVPPSSILDDGLSTLINWNVELQCESFKNGINSRIISPKFDGLALRHTPLLQC